MILVQCNKPGYAAAQQCGSVDYPHKEEQKK